MCSVKSKNNKSKYVSWTKNGYSTLLEFSNYVKESGIGEIIPLNDASSCEDKTAAVIGKVIRLTPRLSEGRKSVCKKLLPATTVLIKEYFYCENNIQFGKVFKAKFIGSIATEIKSADIHIGDYIALVNPLVRKNTDFSTHPNVNENIALLLDNSSASVLLNSKVGQTAVINKDLECLRCTTPVSDQQSESDIVNELASNSKLLNRKATTKRCVLKEHHLDNRPKKLQKSVTNDRTQCVDSQQPSCSSGPFLLKSSKHVALIENIENPDSVDENINNDRVMKNTHKKPSADGVYNFVKLKSINERYLNKKVDLFVVVLDIRHSDERKKKCLITKVLDETCLKFKPFTIYMYYEDQKPKVETKWILRVRHVKIECFNGVYDGRIFSAGSVVSFSPTTGSLEAESPITYRKSPYDLNEFDMSRVAELRNLPKKKCWNVLLALYGFYPSLPSVVPEKKLKDIAEDDSWFSLKCEVVQIRLFFDFNIIVLTVEDGTILKQDCFLVPKTFKLWSEVILSKEVYSAGKKQVDIIIKNIMPTFDNINLKQHCQVVINNIQILRNPSSDREKLTFVYDASGSAKINVLKNHKSLCDVEEALRSENFDSEDVLEEEAENSELTRRYIRTARKMCEGLVDLPEHFKKDAGIDVNNKLLNQLKKEEKKLFHRGDEDYDMYISSSESFCDFYDLSKKSKNSIKGDCKVVLKKLPDRAHSISENSKEKATSEGKENITEVDETEHIVENKDNDVTCNESSEKHINDHQEKEHNWANAKHHISPIVSNNIKNNFVKILERESIKVVPKYLPKYNLLPVVKITKIDVNNIVEELKKDNDSVVNDNRNVNDLESSPLSSSSDDSVDDGFRNSCENCCVVSRNSTKLICNNSKYENCKRKNYWCTSDETSEVSDSDDIYNEDNQGNKAVCDCDKVDGDNDYDDNDVSLNRNLRSRKIKPSYYKDVYNPLNRNLRRRKRKLSYNEDDNDDNDNDGGGCNNSYCSGNTVDFNDLIKKLDIKCEKAFLPEIAPDDDILSLKDDKNNQNDKTQLHDVEHQKISEIIENKLDVYDFINKDNDCSSHDLANCVPEGKDDGNVSHEIPSGSINNGNNNDVKIINGVADNVDDTGLSTTSSCGYVNSSSCCVDNNRFVNNEMHVNIFKVSKRKRKKKISCSCDNFLDYTRKRRKIYKRYRVKKMKPLTNEDTDFKCSGFLPVPTSDRILRPKRKIISTFIHKEYTVNNLPFNNPNHTKLLFKRRKYDNDSNIPTPTEKKAGRTRKVKRNGVMYDYHHRRRLHQTDVYIPYAVEHCNSPVHIIDNQVDSSEININVDEDSDSFKSEETNYLNKNIDKAPSPQNNQILLDQDTNNNVSNNRKNNSKQNIYKITECSVLKNNNISEESVPQVMRVGLYSKRSNILKKCKSDLIEYNSKDKFVNRHNTTPLFCNRSEELKESDYNNDLPRSLNSVSTFALPVNCDTTHCGRTTFDMCNADDDSNSTDLTNKICEETVNHVEEWLEKMEADTPDAEDFENHIIENIDRIEVKEPEVEVQQKSLREVEKKNGNKPEENIPVEKSETEYSPVESQSQKISEFVKIDFGEKPVQAAPLSAVIVKSQMSFTAFMWDVKPALTDDVLDIISGYCKDSCENFFVYSTLKFTADSKPICPRCITKGKEVKVKLQFLFELLLILQTGHSILGLAYGDHANKFLGCNEQEYLQNADTRIKVLHKLQYYLGTGHNASIRYTPPVHVNLVPISLTSPEQTTFIRFCIINTTLSPPPAPNDNSVNLSTS